jgi:2-desacetyl-2-hydroxyethyl bacteriochlorophyllide A dehydrogenase
LKCIICEQPDRLSFQELKPPTGPGPGEALVRIRRIGICGTDLHAFKGNQPFFTYPRVLGHELAGVIEEVGPNPFNLKPGDQVAIIPYLECGKCRACRIGKTNCCSNLKVLGVHMDGGMAELLSVPYDHLVPTAEISLDQSVILEPLSIGAHAVRRAELQKEEQVLIIGAGPIGLSVMAFASQQGARVSVMDINQDRLNFSRTWANIENTVNALDKPMEALLDITGGDLPSVVFDATGSARSMMESFNFTANGGKLVFVGLVKGDITFADPEFHRKELTLFASRNSTKEDFGTVKQVVQSGGINSASYITHRTDFDHMIENFEGLFDPTAGVIKAIIDL